MSKSYFLRFVRKIPMRSSGISGKSSARCGVIFLMPTRLSISTSMRLRKCALRISVLDVDAMNNSAALFSRSNTRRLSKHTRTPMPISNMWRQRLVLRSPRWERLQSIWTVVRMILIKTRAKANEKSSRSRMEVGGVVIQPVDEEDAGNELSCRRLAAVRSVLYFSILCSSKCCLFFS